MTPPLPASQIHLHDPSPTQTKRAYIIYFITGNPGLIEYYRTFLTHLYGLLTQSSPPSTSFHVFGRSLSGFEASTSTTEKKDDNLPFSLQEQISRSQAALEKLVRDVREKDGVQDVRVILIGHSVGSFILLEVIRRVREKATIDGEAVRIAGGVCLFPTVTHIAKSDSGKRATPLLTLPHSPLIASTLAQVLTSLLPLSILTILIQKLLSFPPSAAHTTASFVKSPHGVHQALHMARDEMREITEDAWSTEIWGLSNPSSPSQTYPPPTLRFLFAQNDHWVADHTRDDLIAARGRSRAGEGDEAWKPVMEIDTSEGWEHGFCIRQSVHVAERVGGWVKEMVERDAAQ
ncbi:hypothetical protein P171DRAFT_251282 [Karstenula rhodostoma CBS 690.94]|uniref:Uncharacterized protein n=1 Tax=Karstenula rhodostoma CBS 690.94 TaxID=1392251 RepID=A0A9P4UDD1_9PLEO|nr:hypothetical protein P171DRAFT_251282 [Karstenula rhodostoma CBS 690.94]